jgi:hypothetical protein
MLTRITVDCRVWFAGKCGFNRGLRRLGNELVFLGQMHQHGRMKPIDLSQIFLSVTAVISDRSVDALAHGCQKDHQRAEAMSEDGNPPVQPGSLATAFAVSLTSMAPASRS